MIAAVVVAASPAAAERFVFTSTVTSHGYNFRETTGQSLGLLQPGDRIQGMFDFILGPLID